MKPMKQRSCAIGNKEHAECPFFAEITAPFIDEHQLRRKRKRGRPDKQPDYIQRSPFTHVGKFKSCQSLDVLYTIRPHKAWSTMTRCRKVVLENITYRRGDFVYVANDRSTSPDAANKDFEQLFELHWVAKILEIRALDDTHVYARVYWMYLPDDLLENTVDGQKVVLGRQPYHGPRELIASNHKMPQVEPDSTKHQPEALLPAVHKINDGSRLGQSGHCDLTPQQVDTSMYATLGAAMPESPLLARAVRRLHKQTDYSASSKSNVQTTISKLTFAVEAMSRGKRLVSSTGASSTNAQLSSVNLSNVPPTDPFPLASCSYFPFKTQHQLLAGLQHVLELACHRFGELMMPEILLSQGWDCAERVELNHRTRLLKQRRDILIGITEKSAEEFFRSIAGIRHYAVHRKQVSTESLKEHFVDAETLVVLFGDDESRSHVVMLWQKAIPELECNAVAQKEGRSLCSHSVNLERN
ncbi:hypothetical protein GGI35DRAFT_472871 [Trichoderma velutinum]